MQQVSCSLPLCPSCSMHSITNISSTSAGSEIVAQTAGKLHAFVAGAGTGGTIAGVSHILKQHNPSTRVVLVDPPGSSLYNKVHGNRIHTCIYTPLVPSFGCQYCTGTAPWHHQGRQ